MHRYQNMLWCNIPSWDRADFSALAYTVHHFARQACYNGSKDQQSVWEEKITIFGLQPANIWEWNQRWQWFVELSFQIGSWFLQFFSMIEFKNRHVFCLRERDRYKLMPVNIRLFCVKKNQFIQCINMGHISWNPCRIENSSIITVD